MKGERTRKLKTKLTRSTMKSITSVEVAQLPTIGKKTLIIIDKLLKIIFREREREREREIEKEKERVREKESQRERERESERERKRVIKCYHDITIYHLFTLLSKNEVLLSTLCHLYQLFLMPMMEITK